MSFRITTGSLTFMLLAVLVLAFLAARSVTYHAMIPAWSQHMLTALCTFSVVYTLADPLVLLA